MLLKVPVYDGGDEFIEVEVDRADVVGPVELAANGGRTATAAFSLAASIDRVLPAVSTIITRVRAATHAPDDVEMELGLKVGGETGLVFAKTSGEATFTVRLKWHKPKPDQDGGSFDR